MLWEGTQMIQSNYHIHSTFCDGKNTIAEMAEAARASGLKSIGFSSHFPLKYTNDWTMAPEALAAYCEAVRDIQQAYADKMEVYLGVEVDYYLDSRAPSPLLSQWRDRLDYIIGSIHTMGAFEDGSDADIDYTPENFEEGLRVFYGGDIRAFLRAYYEGIADMALGVKPDIIGHLDLPKKNNAGQRFFDESAPWYRDLWQNALEAIAKSGCILEINSGGVLRYGSHCLYPSKDILEQAQALKIPVTISADSHSTHGIAYYYPEMETMLRKAGYRAVMAFNGKGWVEKSL
jgi:histidinol-phosphatase (PHP family)